MKRKYLALGDSYTVGVGVEEGEQYPYFLQRLLAQQDIAIDVEIFAQSGWSAKELYEAIEEQNINSQYDLISLLVGVNNEFRGESPEKFLKEFEELLQRVIKLANGISHKIVIFSIPNYAYTPFGLANDFEEIKNRIPFFNNAKRQIARKYNVSFINITDLTEQGLISPELVTNDSLHPSAKMYKLWMELCLSKIMKIL